MNRTEELKALRKSAAALNQSDYEVVKRLENAYDHVSLMLDALHDQCSTQTLRDIDDGIEILIERLGDTQTILRLVLRERELETKLAKLVEEVSPKEEPLSLKDMILAKLKAGEPVFTDDAVNELSIDPETLRRIEQRQQLESLVDTLYTSEQAQKIKKMLEKDKDMSLDSRVEVVNVRVPRPMRDLDANIPTVKRRRVCTTKAPNGRAMRLIALIVELSGIFTVD